ncbi:MAG: hypothetical protein HZC49_00820 [Nitrospirae bacterium]|nr:hypothetical protein [Nitrospirota bacterium]
MDDLNERETIIMQPLKKEVLNLLEQKKYQEIMHTSASFHKIMNVLVSLSYDKNKYISWRAIEAIGLISKEIAKSDTETVRNIVGRLLWMIRDESGGIGWSVPETLGEIVRNNPQLCADIAPIIASFHDEKMLTAGVLWALGRIGKINDQTVGYAIPIILARSRFASSEWVAKYSSKQTDISPRSSSGNSSFSRRAAYKS